MEYPPENAYAARHKDAGRAWTLLGCKTICTNAAAHCQCEKPARLRAQVRSCDGVEMHDVTNLERKSELFEEEDRRFELNVLAFQASEFRAVDAAPAIVAPVHA